MMKKKSPRQRLKETLAKKGSQSKTVLEAQAISNSRDIISEGASKVIRDDGKLRIEIEPDCIPYRKPINVPCYACGSERLWESKSGVIICCVCHPPVYEKDIERLIYVNEVEKGALGYHV